MNHELHRNRDLKIKNKNRELARGKEEVAHGAPTDNTPHTMSRVSQRFNLGSSVENLSHDYD